MKESELRTEQRDLDDLKPVLKSIMRKEKSIDQVLMALALHGPSNVWDLSSLKDMHTGYTPIPWISVNRYLQDLAKIGMVESAGRRRAIRGRGSSKLYCLTLFGLVYELLGEKEVEAQREQVLSNYSKVLPKEKLEEVTQFHELVREVEKEYPDFRDGLLPNRYAYTHKILLENWIENPVRVCLRRMYESGPDWKFLENSLPDKPHIIQYSLQIVKDMIDTYEKDLAQARSFMKTLRTLARGKIPERPEAPETKEPLSKWVDRLLAQDSPTGTRPHTSS